MPDGAPVAPPSAYRLHRFGRVTDSTLRPCSILVILANDCAKRE
ncbi:Uncharacterised protein [Vibrio cholerae]|nr:Uncharacterised protein [Vibrio cholerae]CSI47677.1 Uncharacterised protein [Vibrio cholerae]